MDAAARSFEGGVALHPIGRYGSISEVLKCREVVWSGVKFITH
jgi:hypothetical protein